MSDELINAGPGDDDGGGSHPWPWKQGMLPAKGKVGLLPIRFRPDDVIFLLSDLVGRKLRVSSGVVTTEIDPGRVTILVEEGTHRITDMWVDPDLPKE